MCQAVFMPQYAEKLLVAMHPEKLPVAGLMEADFLYALVYMFELPTYRLCKSTDIQLFCRKNMKLAAGTNCG